jgi:hypothetical protein
MPDRSLRLLTLGSSDEPLWVRLYIYPLGDEWTVTIMADDAEPPKPGELRATGCFGERSMEAKEVALHYLGGCMEQH